jgi:SAM-dependent methyltransferase
VSLRYRIMYRVGFKPWDNELAGAELEAAAAERPPGRAMDVGCGTGTQAVYLARQGWEVTAVDAVPRALDAARERARAAGVEVQWLQADVGALDRAGLEPGYTLFHDRGCFHDISDETRAGYVRGVTALAAPGAVFLLMAFGPGGRGPGPKIAPEAVAAAFADGWTLVSTEPDTGPAPPGPMRNAVRLWHRLERRA